MRKLMGMVKTTKLYVDGISVTNGIPKRKHIWTFVALHEDGHGICMCDNGKFKVVKSSKHLFTDYFRI